MSEIKNGRLGLCGKVYKLQELDFEGLKSKVVPYLITRVGLGADPGFLAAGDISHKPGVTGCRFFPPAHGYFPSQRDHPLGRYNRINPETKLVKYE